MLHNSVDVNARAAPHVVNMVTITSNAYKLPCKTDSEMLEGVLWKVLELCLARRAADHHKSALAVLNVNLSNYAYPSFACVMGGLTTNFPLLVSSLQTFCLVSNYGNETSELVEFSRAATQLREFTIRDGLGLSSMKGLEGNCPYLKKVDLRNCSKLTSLEGLQNRERLEELNVSSAAIANLQQLTACPALIKVNLSECKQLTSLSGLEDHALLEVVSLFGCSAITSAVQLLSCPALKKLDLRYCRLATLSDLEGHQRLEDIHVPANVSSLLALLKCPALRKVNLSSCSQISSLAGLEGHKFLEEVDASHSAIECVQALLTCPALTDVNLRLCERLTSLSGLEGHEHLKKVDATGASITNVEPLRTCPALTDLDFTECSDLKSIAGLEHHLKLRTVELYCTPVESIRELASCPALTKVTIEDCYKLKSLRGECDQESIERLRACCWGYSTCFDDDDNDAESSSDDEDAENYSDEATSDKEEVKYS